MKNYPTPVYGPPDELLILIDLAFISLMLWIMWRFFAKAGRPGWTCLIPFYNLYVFLKIIGRPGWWIILFFIPIINIIIHIVTSLDLAKSFGKSPVFAIFGLFFFPLIGYPILVFGKSKYLGPGGK